jgi:hypothetical protein
VELGCPLGQGFLLGKPRPVLFERRTSGSKHHDVAIVD